MAGAGAEKEWEKGLSCVVITTGCHLRYLNHSLFNCFLCTILGCYLDSPAPCSHVLRPSRSLTYEIVPKVGPISGQPYPTAPSSTSVVDVQLEASWRAPILTCWPGSKHGLGKVRSGCATLTYI